MVNFTTALQPSDNSQPGNQLHAGAAHLQTTETTISNTTNMRSFTTTLRRMVLVAGLLMLTSIGYGQSFQCYIDNDISTANTYDFDIKVKASSGTIKFNGFQFGMFVNPSFLGSGAISVSIQTYSGP